MLIILHNPWNAETTAHVKTPVSSGQGLREQGSAQRESQRQSALLPLSLPPSPSPSHSKRPQIYNQSLRNFVIRARIRYTAAKMMRRQTNSADAQNQRERLFFFFFSWGEETSEGRRHERCCNIYPPPNVSLRSYVTARPHWSCTDGAGAQSRSWPCWCHMTNPHAALAYNPPTNHLQSYHKD